MLSGVLAETRSAARRNKLRHGPVVRDQLTVRICQTDAGGKREKAAAARQPGADGGVSGEEAGKMVRSSVMPRDVMSYNNLHSFSLLETQPHTFIPRTRRK